MLHGEGWQFIQMGRFMERVQATARLIDLHFAEFFPSGRRSHERFRAHGVDRAAPQLHRVRSVLQGLYGRPAPGTRGRVSAAERRVSAFGAIRAWTT